MRIFAQEQNQPQRRAFFSLARSNTAASGPIHHTHSLLHLQSTIGNRAMQRMLKTNPEELKAGLTDKALSRFGHDFHRIPIHPPAAAVQTKMAINKPEDEYEQEADSVSQRVMRMPEPQVHRACACGGECPDCRSRTEQPKQNTERLQTKRVRETAAEDVSHAPRDVVGLEVGPQTESAVRNAAGGGAPMPKSVRALFEPHFGRDFSHVRIHTGPMAESTSQRLRASAFTFGSDIFFNSGQYKPHTGSGLGLLAHELAHVIQQQTGSVSRRLIQRAEIPYRQITWADFLAAPPNNPSSPEGAGILTKFDRIPSFSPVTTAKATKKKCKVGKTRATEVESTAAPDPADFNKPEAVMDQDQSWALARYTGSSNDYCAGEAAKCEQQFDSIAAQIRTMCGQKSNECKRAFDGGQKSFGFAIGNDAVTVASKAECTTKLLVKCQEFSMKGASLTVGAVTVRTKADCRENFLRQCPASEVPERARLLRHEQAHFDITNVMAKNARESLRLKAASLPVKEIGCGEDAARDAARNTYESNVKSALTQLGTDWLASKDRAQTDYDDQTGHGAKAAEQRSWEAAIQAGLKAYYPATAPAPAAAPTPAATPTSPPTAPTRTSPPASPSPAPTPAPRKGLLGVHWTTIIGASNRDR
jgi:Domain of unknown function (DUF4157)